MLILQTLVHNLEENVGGGSGVGGQLSLKIAMPAREPREDEIFRLGDRLFSRVELETTQVKLPFNFLRDSLVKKPEDLSMTTIFKSLIYFDIKSHLEEGWKYEEEHTRNTTILGDSELHRIEHIRREREHKDVLEQVESDWNTRRDKFFSLLLDSLNECTTHMRDALMGDDATTVKQVAEDWKKMIREAIASKIVQARRPGVGAEDAKAAVMSAMNAAWNWKIE